MKDKLLGFLPFFLSITLLKSSLGRFLLPFSMAHILHIIVGHPVVPQEDPLLVLLSIPPEAATELVHPQ